MLVEFADQMEQQRPAVLGEGQVAELIQNDGILVEQPGGQTAGFALALFGIQLIDQVDDAVEACPLALQDHLTSQSGGQMCFSGAGSADEHDVAGGAQILPGVQLADLGLVHQ